MKQVKEMSYVIDAEESKRINIIKFLSIIFVVFIHAYSNDVSFAGGMVELAIPDWLKALEFIGSRIIAECAVPMFFLLSAILLFRRQRGYIDTLRSRVYTLGIPYVIWNTFWIVVFIILQENSTTAHFFSGSKTAILQCDFVGWLHLYGIGTKFPQDYPLWFMRDLMLMVMVFPLIGRFAERFSKGSILLGLILIFLPVEFSLKMALSWFLIGAGMVKAQIRISYFDSINLSACAVIYFAGLIITYVISSVYMYELFILYSVFFWIRLSKCIYHMGRLCDILTGMTKWTFMIYVFHELTLTSCKKVFAKLLPTQDALVVLLEYFLIPLFVISLCIIVGKCLKRFVPGFYHLAARD